MLVMRMNNDTVYDLKNVLASCKKTASMGYRIAKQESRHLNETLTSAKSEIESTIIDFENSPCYVSAITDLLKEQLFEIRDSFDSLSVLINEDLANLRENLSKFSITLLDNSIQNIDNKIKEIQSTRTDRNQLCRDMEEMQSKCHTLIREIHLV